MGNLLDLRERQKFLLEQVNLNRQQLKSSGALPIMQADVIGRLMELFENKDEQEYMRLCRLHLRWVPVKDKMVDMKPFAAPLRMAS